MSRAPHFELKEEKKNVACSNLGWKEAIRSKYSIKTYPLCRLTSRCSRFYLWTSPFLPCPPCPPCLPCPPLQQCSSRRVQHATDRFMLQPLRTWEVCLSTVFQEYSNTELILQILVGSPNRNPYHSRSLRQSISFLPFIFEPSIAYLSPRSHKEQANPKTLFTNSLTTA